MAKKEVGILGDIAQGVQFGASQAIRGVAELGASSIDLFADTDLTADLKRFFDERQTDKPETTAGEIASFITQFGLPGFGAAGVLGRVNKLSNIQKAAVFGAVDGAVATDDTVTLLDTFVDNDSDEERLARLRGSEAAYERLLERANVAAEASSFIFGLPYALKAVGYTGGAVIDEALAPIFAKAVAKTQLGNKSKSIQKAGDDIEETNLKLFDRAKNYFSTKGVGAEGLAKPNEYVAQLSHIKTAEVLQNLEEVNRNTSIIQNTITKLGQSGLSQTNALQLSRDIEDSLFPMIKVNFQKPNLSLKQQRTLAEKIQTQANKNIKDLEKKINYKSFGIEDNAKISTLTQNVRNQADSLSRQVLELSRSEADGFGNLLIQKDLHEVISGNIGLYGTRSYKTYLDSNIPIDPNLRKFAEDEIQKIVGVDAQDANYIFNLIARRTPTNKDYFGFETGEFILDGLGKNKDILKGKTLDDLPKVRRALGEVAGYLESTPEKAMANTALKAATTVNKLSSLVAKTKMFRDIKELDNLATRTNQKKFLKNSDFAKGKEVQKINDINTVTVFDKDNNPIRYKQFNQEHGQLDGMYARSDYFDALLRTTTSLEANGSVLMDFYKPFLSIKAATQYGKTVLSPLAQVRNNTSVPFFAMLNGLVGSTGRLKDSYANTFAGLLDPSSQLLRKDKLDELLVEGVMQRGGASQLGEVLENARIASQNRGVDRAIKGVSNIPGVKNVTKFSEDVYKMTDDTARVYAYENEKIRFKSALQNVLDNPNLKAEAYEVPIEASKNILRFKDIIKVGKNGGPVIDVRNLKNIKVRENPLDSKNKKTIDALEAFARSEMAELTLNTVQNYKRVVPIVREIISKLPIGNFTAFPAEVTRNGVNALHRSIKELASANPEIQKIGMRRLTGVATTGGFLSGGLVALGSYLTGVTKEKIDAYKRSAGAPWDKTATLVPVGSDGLGNPTEFFNFSYMNPYDLFQRPANRILAEIEEGNRNEESLTKIAVDSFGGALTEFTAPFVEPAFGLNSVLEAVNGRTGTGRRIWGEDDTQGDRALKGFAYVLDSINPAGMPFRPVVDPAGTSLLPGKNSYIDIRLKDGPKSLFFKTKNGEPIKGRTGRELDAGETVIQALSGIKTIKPDMEQALLYSSFEANRAIRDTSNAFNRALTTMNEDDAKRYIQAYINENEDRYRVLRDLYTNINDSRLLGLNEPEIINTLKRGKITNYNEVLRGTFVPIPITSEKINEAIEGGAPVNYPDLKDIEYLLKDQKLKGRFKDPRRNAPFRRPFLGAQILRQQELEKLVGGT